MTNPISCSDAHALLDQGLEPGSHTSLRLQLGFHLAGCPNCRRYQATLHHSLLYDLLVPQSAQLPVKQHTPRAITARKRPSLARIAVASLAVIMVLVLLRVTSQVLAIRQNVQAYIVPTAQPHTLAFQALSATITPPMPTSQPVNNPSVPAVAEPASGAVTAVPTSVPRPSLVPIRPTEPGASASLLPTLPVVTATPYIPLSGSSAVTILLLGSDSRPDESGIGRTDTVIIARVDPGLRRVALLSLPRDLIVEIPGYGYGRINAAYVYGELYPELGGGLALSRATISNLLGVPIDYAMRVDFEGFIGLIDAVGGVDLEVPTALYDDSYPTMDYGTMEVYFEPGLQHMDGARALQYARIRHMDNDFNRARRQQQIIVAAGKQLRNQNPFELLDSITALTASLRGYVWTDLPEERMVGLAWALRDLSPDAIERFLIDEQYVTFNGEGGGCSSWDDYWAACISKSAIQPVIQQWAGSAR